MGYHVECRNDKERAPLCARYRGSIERLARLSPIHLMLPRELHRIGRNTGPVPRLMDKAMEDQRKVEGMKVQKGIEESRVLLHVLRKQ